jgi:hypothetical protein
LRLRVTPTAAATAAAQAALDSPSLATAAVMEACYDVAERLAGKGEGAP